MKTEKVVKVPSKAVCPYSGRICRHATQKPFTAKIRAVYEGIRGLFGVKDKPKESLPMPDRRNWPIGAKGTIHGKTVVCVPSENVVDCEGCVLYGSGCTDMSCIGYLRADKTSVKFVEVKKN